jgi:hypothetical protein
MRMPKIVLVLENPEFKRSRTRTTAEAEDEKRK